MEPTAAERNLQTTTLDSYPPELQRAIAATRHGTKPLDAEPTRAKELQRKVTAAA